MSAHASDATVNQAAGEAAPPHSIVHYLVEAVPVDRPDTKAGDARARLIGRRYDDASQSSS
jgi:hypothetical protein